MTRVSSDFQSFFSTATGGFSRYEWQARVAKDGVPEILPIPTGLGKTEGAVLGWAWRKFVADIAEPTHLIYCLPMRSLVTQTVDRLKRCFERLSSEHMAPLIPVYRLMGGAIDEEWARWPERPWVLVGTQDQLLSRALNRGYAMSRFDWPVHFGLLNQDCRWIVDEVQLMGPGLWTTSQLDWMRRKRFFSLKECPTTWMSATVGTSFLATTDRTRDGLDHVQPFDAQLDHDPNEELKRRRAARRPLEWFAPAKGKRALPLPGQIADRAVADHAEGTLSLVICNTVRMAQSVFRALPNAPPKILLTSRFRQVDRRASEQQLLDFEGRRSAHASGRMESNSGLICVSTQVIEAGVDVSAHRLWTELAPWPSMIQRLGRLNRDGRDNEARSLVWKTPKGNERKREGELWIGPYRKRAIEETFRIISAIIEPSTSSSFSEAVKTIENTQEVLLRKLLEPEPAPFPRAFDVHGLFSTERDVHGGFTDISAFVRGSDPESDVTVFWRFWQASAPPRGDDLDGPPFDAQHEACSVPFYRLAEFLKANRARGWIWDDEEGLWQPIVSTEIRPGMVVMLNRDVGGYDVAVGWTGEHTDIITEVTRPGRGRTLRDDDRTEIGYWSRLGVHLSDARSEAERICDAFGLSADDESLRPLRISIVEGAGLHDLGKAHPKWQTALPTGAALDGRPWAKCPRVLAVDTRLDGRVIRETLARVSPRALPLPDQQRRNCRRLRWAVSQRLTRDALNELKALKGVDWAGHVPLRSGMRHEAATALVMWNRYREGLAAYPALAVYLAAAHHGKVRTVMRSTIPGGGDAFGVGHNPDTLEIDGERWGLDFTVAADGATGEWQDGEFLLTGHGWTGVVADLLGPWRALEEDPSEVGAVPLHEPRQLGPFVLAWLEALVRVADWRASENPSQCIKPEDISHAR